MSNNVFTIFCHGTDFHRDKDPNELIDRLSAVTVGQEARIVQTGTRTDNNIYPFRLESPTPTFLICEGPGSESGTTDDGVTYAHPGKYNPIFGTKKGKGQDENPGIALKGAKKYWFMGEQQASDFQSSFMGNTAEEFKTLGLALGWGWDDNVYKATWMLTHLKFELGLPIDTVNIVGWSWGGVTCLKIASKLFEVFEDTIDVNICAVDPVPGGYTERTLDMLAIPPNVRNYLAILALDADGGNFLPTDRDKMSLLAPQSQHGNNGNPDSRNPGHLKPHVHFLPFPGNHSDVVNLAYSNKTLIPKSAALCRHIAWSFLNAHGTETSEDLSLKRGTICQFYNELLPNLAQIAKDASTGGYLSFVEGWKTERKVRKYRDRYVTDSQHYLNEHHRMCALGKDYPTAPADKQFPGEDWVKWGSEKTIPLPPQTHLTKMGLRP
ncbi:MAG: hypothetical protein AAGD25_19185 [Cyanobacteria bacterium P01_F01_bin.150]